MAVEQLKPSLLVVEDDADFAWHVVSRPFRGAWEVHFAYNIPQALEAVDGAGELDLALVDLNLPGGRPFDGAELGGGFEVVARARNRFPRARVIVVTGHLESRLVNQATLLGAQFLFKSCLSAQLEELAQALRTSDRSLHSASRAFASELRDSYRLSERETEIVACSLECMSKSEIAAELGVSPNTVKSQIRSILDKCGIDRMARLRDWLRCRYCPRA